MQRQSLGVLTVSTSFDPPRGQVAGAPARRFAEAFPEIEYQGVGDAASRRLRARDIDLAVRHGDGHWTGLHVTRLCSEELFPVCSPRLATDARPLNRPADLLGFPLLHLDDRTTWATGWRPPGSAMPKPCMVPS